MAAAAPLQNIKAEVTCSICRELFWDPVTSACGHSFCRECIARLCQGDREVACPQCKEKLKQGNLRPNRELRNIVELVKSQAVEDPRGGYVCKTHREPLRFYCREDQTPVCVACERSWAHRTHTVVPVEDVIQYHRGTIRQHLEGIESSYQKLHLFLTMDRTYLPQSEREEEHQRLQRLADNVATLLKVDTKSLRQRSKGAVSQTQPCDPSKVAGETESQEHKGREPGSKPAAEKQEETGSHVVHVCEEAPTPKEGLNQASLDQFIHTISSTTGAAQCMETIRQQLEGIESGYETLNQLVSTDQTDLSQSEREQEHQRLNRVIDNIATLLKVAVKETRKRPKDGSSLTPAEGSGGSRTDASSVSSEEEGNGAPAGDRKQRNPLLPPTPAPVPEPPHQTEQHSGRKPGSEPKDEKQKETGSSVNEETSTTKQGLGQGSLDDTIDKISDTTGKSEPKVAVKEPRKRPKEGSSTTPAEGSGGSRTGAIPASSEQEGAAKSSGTEAAREGQQHPGSKKSKNKKRKNKKHR